MLLGKPSEGLAPIVVGRVGDLLKRLRANLLMSNRPCLESDFCHAGLPCIHLSSVPVSHRSKLVGPTVRRGAVKLTFFLKRNVLSSRIRSFLQQTHIAKTA